MVAYLVLRVIRHVLSLAGVSLGLAIQVLGEVTFLLRRWRARECTPQEPGSGNWSVTALGGLPDYC